MQNIMFERFLDRLSRSEYRDKFVIKGGMLISAIVGLATRSTFDKIITPLSIDISTGDIITPDAVKYEISGILDDSISITLWGYSIETVLAEKAETILSRDITNTRPRDYYDVYILRQKGKYDPVIFRNALIATAEHRGSWNRIKEFEPILSQIETSRILKDLWEKYRREFNYAKDISFEDIVSAIRGLLSVFESEN